MGKEYRYNGPSDFKFFRTIQVSPAEKKTQKTQLQAVGTQTPAAEIPDGAIVGPP